MSAYGKSRFFPARLFSVSVGTALLIWKNRTAGIPKVVMGDDLGWISAVLSGNHPLANPLSALFVDVLGKWRPLTQFWMTFGIWFSGSTPEKYLPMTGILLAVVALISAKLFEVLNPELSYRRSVFAQCLIIVLVMGSHFPDLYTFSPFAMMELPPLALLLSALTRYLSSSGTTVEVDRWIVTFVWCAVLFHERYLVFVLGIWIWTVLNVWRKREMSAEAVRAFSINIGASIGYWYVKTQIVKVPFLVAGGEDSISAGLGIRGLALRWSDAFVASLGFNSGAGVFYWADGTISVLSREPESLILSALIAILIILPFLSHRLGVRFSFIGQGEQVGDMRLRVAVYVAVIALLPGVTIVSRIEARWVFLSWIIVLVAATSQAIRISLRLTASLFILVLASVVNPNLTERWREIHVFPADRMVEEIRNTSPRSPADKNEWSLLYLNRRISGYWDTQEQKLFEMIPHRPLDIDFESTNCELKTCLLVVQYPAETDIVVLDPVHSRS